jgi:alanine dehydrogenase
VKVGIPREVKNSEYRVAITPAGANELTRHGHDVFVETGAGLGSSITDAEYAAAGAKILPDADAVWGTGDLILKVKEPIAEEYPRMRPGQVLFTYLHLAASRDCTQALLDRQVTGIAYETVELPGGALPLLAPMSEVAGRLAPQVGSYHLMRTGGGRGVLMGGVPGVYAAKVVVIGAVLVPGAKAPKLVSNELVSRMKKGSVLVDISIDQGGCFEDSRPTTHADPVYTVHDSVFYCVANMPGAVPHTSTYALTNVTLPYALDLANMGWRDALRNDRALALGLNTHDGHITYGPVAEAHGMPAVKLEEVLA